MANQRQHGFDVLIAPNSEQFLFFGPVQPGETLRELVLRLSDSAVENPTWQLRAAMFKSQPAADGSDFDNGVQLFGPAGLRAGPTSDISGAPLFFASYPLNLVGGDEYRYVGFHIDTTSVAGITSGHAVFDCRWAQSP